MVLHGPIAPLPKEERSSSNFFSATTSENNLAALRRILIARKGDEKTQQQDPSPQCIYSTRRKKTKGPQRLILFSKATGSTIEATSLKGLNLQPLAIKQIFSSGESEPWWLDFQNPTDSELVKICAAFDVHPLTVEDMLICEFREKMVNFQTYYFICLRTCQLPERYGRRDLYQPHPIYILVFPNGALTFSFHNNDHGNRVRKRLNRYLGVYELTSDWIPYAFTDDIVDYFSPSIEKIERLVEYLEDLVYTIREEDMQQFVVRIEMARKAVASIRRLIHGKLGVLSSLKNHRCGPEDDEDDIEKLPIGNHELRFYISDVQDHLETMLSSLTQFESLLSRSLENYVAGLKMIWVDEKLQLHRKMRFLTIFGFATSINTLVQAFFSMNINANVPLFAGPSNWFYYLLALQIFATVALFIYTKRKKWY